MAIFIIIIIIIETRKNNPRKRRVQAFERDKIGQDKREKWRKKESEKKVMTRKKEGGK